MIFIWDLIQVGKASDAIITLIGQYFSDFTDIFFTDIALNLVRGIHDVLQS